MSDTINIDPEIIANDIDIVIQHFVAKRDVRLLEFIDLINFPSHVSFSHYCNYLTEISVLLTFLMSKTEDIDINIPLEQFAATHLTEAFEKILKQQIEDINNVETTLALFKSLFQSAKLDHFDQNYLFNIWTKYVFRQMDIQTDEMKLADYLGIS